MHTEHTIRAILAARWPAVAFQVGGERTRRGPFLGVEWRDGPSLWAVEAALQAPGPGPPDPFIACTRYLSVAFLRAVAVQVCADRGVPVPDIIDGGGDAQIVEHGDPALDWIILGRAWALPANPHTHA